MKILGIETSCDETAAAVLEFGRPSTRSRNIKVNILSNVVSSQMETHKKTGGVVPEVAARAHMEQIIPVIEDAMRPVVRPKTSDVSNKRTRLTPYDLSHTTPKIDAIAVTYGPGLITSLSVGVETARTLAWSWNVPLIGVNHIEGHISAAYLQRTPRIIKSSEAESYNLTALHYPALALVVSGGHTELVLIKKPLSYKIIGATRDDAVGEAFDKVARILGLEYPGGPIVSRLAEQGDASEFPFSPPMLKSNDYEFSFSGIKTAVLYKVRDQRAGIKDQVFIRDICASFQKAVVEVLVAKTIRAAKEYKIKTIILAGGVAANKQLREQLADAIKQHLPHTTYLLPTPQFCTDNAVMIATAGYFHALKKEFTPWQKIDVNPNLVLGSKL